MRELGTTEIDPDHPCTDVSLYAPDLDLLAYMLQDLRGLIRSNDAGRVELEAHQPIFWEVHGLRRRTVVCEPDDIRRPDRVCIVGFLAERREEIDYVSLDDLELSLLMEFRRYPGILSYTSIELANDYWANLVVHRVPDDTEEWRRSAAHAHAVEVSPRLYSSVRIHNGHLDGGVVGNQAIVVDCTKYWDYGSDPVWQAVRVFDPPLQRTRRQLEELHDASRAERTLGT
ncbi:MAG: hypothetical protein HKN41_05690 [Ilumatobacter sp.]|nr:hypothetical protein [Ilumatobacter sp.]